MASPFYQRQIRNAAKQQRLLDRMIKISSRQSGESGGGIDYENKRVQKLSKKLQGLNQNKNISYNEVDPRIEEQGRRYDSDINYGSPLKGAYDQGGGGLKYVSILPHVQKLQQSFANMALQSESKRWDKKIDEETKADENFMKSGPGKDMSKKGVESRLFKTPEGFSDKPKKPVDIQDINVYEIEDGF